MSYKVVYFTKTGNSKRVAEKIANKLSCQAIQITDNVNWKGLIGFIKGGYYSLKNKDVDIKVNENLKDTDELIVVSPLWASGVAPAIHTFLKTTTLNKVHLVVTSGNSKVKEREGFKSITDIVKSENNEDAVIDELVSHLV